MRRDKVVTKRILEEIVRFGEMIATIRGGGRTGFVTRCDKVVTRVCSARHPFCDMCDSY